ncbi:MAG: hypothetical protein WEE89_06815 [Gemmatimonadota bacterium]
MDRHSVEKKIMRLQKHFMLISLGLIAAAAPISAQTVTLIRPGRYSIAFEAARPYFWVHEPN